MHTINDLPNFTVKLADKCHIREFCDHKLTGAGREAAHWQGIRHDGVLASACKTDKLENGQTGQARLALQMPAPNPKAAVSAQAFMTRAIASRSRGSHRAACLWQCCASHWLATIRRTVPVRLRKKATANTAIGAIDTRHKGTGLGHNRPQETGD